MVSLSSNCSFGKYPSRLLERCSRKERIRSQRSFSDTKKNPSSRSFLRISLHVFTSDWVNVSNLLTGSQSISNLVVCLLEGESVNNLTRKEWRIAWFLNLSLSHHLSNDNFNVLVVDVNTLALINALKVFNKVFVNGCSTCKFKNFVWISWTFGQRVTLNNLHTCLNWKLSKWWNKNRIDDIDFSSFSLSEQSHHSRGHLLTNRLVQTVGIATMLIGFPILHVADVSILNRSVGRNRRFNNDESTKARILDFPYDTGDRANNRLTSWLSSSFEDFFNPNDTGRFTRPRIEEFLSRLFPNLSGVAVALVSRLLSRLRSSLSSLLRLGIFNFFSVDSQRRRILVLEQRFNNRFLGFKQLSRVKRLHVGISCRSKVLHELSNELTGLILVRSRNSSRTRNTTRVERSHRKLGTRLTNRLRSNNSNRNPNFNQF